MFGSTRRWGSDSLCDGFPERVAGCVHSQYLSAKGWANRTLAACKGRPGNEPAGTKIQTPRNALLGSGSRRTCMLLLQQFLPLLQRELTSRVRPKLGFPDGCACEAGQNTPQTVAKCVSLVWTYRTCGSSSAPTARKPEPLAQAPGSTTPAASGPRAHGGARFAILEAHLYALGGPRQCTSERGGGRRPPLAHAPV